MKKIFALYAKDIKNALRDKLFQFMLIAPFILIILAKVLIPSLEGVNVNLITDKSLEQSSLERLKELSAVQVVESEEQIKKLVEDFDDKIGITKSENGYKIILQGNEAEGLKNFAYNIIYSLGKDKNYDLGVESVSLGNKRSQLKEILTAGLILFTVAISGMCMGLTVVEDKESQMIKALAVSPVSMSQYILSKILNVFIYSTVFSAVIYSLMLPGSFEWGKLLLILFGSLFMGIFMGFLIGLIADNQNTAIAAVKILGAIFAMGPLLSFIVPQSFEWIFFFLPGFWVLKLLFSVVTGSGDILFYFIMSLAVNIAGMAVAISFMKRKLGLRNPGLFQKG